MSPSLVLRPNASQLRVDYITARVMCKRSGDVIHPQLRCIGSGHETKCPLCKRSGNVPYIESGHETTTLHSCSLMIFIPILHVLVVFVALPTVGRYSTDE